MKKIVGLVAAFAAVFSLTACDSSEKYDFTCSSTEDDVKTEYKFVVSGDKITKVVAEMSGEASSEEEAKAEEAMYKSSNPGDGVTVSVKRSGKKLTISATADISKIDSDDIDTYLFTTTNTKSEVMAAYEDAGYTCK